MSFLAHALDATAGAVPLTVLLLGLGVGLVGVMTLVGRRRSAALPVAVGAGGGDGVAPPADALLDQRASPLPWGRAVATILLAAVVLLAVTGPPTADVNLASLAVRSVLWGLVALTSLLAGPWWPRVDPLHAAAAGLARASGDAEGAATRPLGEERARWVVFASILGWAVAEAVLLPSVVGFLVLLSGYALVHLAGATVHGTVWLERTEALNVVSRTAGLLAPGGGGPRRRLVGLADSAWLHAVVAGLLAWSLGDLLLETAWWHEQVRAGAGATWLGAALLVGLAGVLLVVVRSACARDGLGPALVPAVGGWLVAHWLPVVLIDGQAMLIWLSDPLRRGWDLLGLTGALVTAAPLPTWLLSALVVAALLAGHTAAVVVAADRAAVRYDSPARAAAAQLELRALLLALLLGAVGLQFGGL